MTETSFSSAAKRYIDWLRNEALPFWRAHARDENGGYFEALSRDGRPLTQRPRRTRVWSRLAYSFAHAALLGWDKEENKKASDHAIEGFRRHALAQGDVSKGAAHLLNPDLSVYDQRRDAYDHAFLILAGVYRYRAFGDERDLALAHDTFSTLDSLMGCADGSYKEGNPDTLPRRQNPHMHLFEAATALAQTTGNTDDIKRCDCLLALFETHFFDRTSGIIKEFFDADWTPITHGVQLVEPGHMAEWAWLLDQYSALSNQDMTADMDRLLRAAITLGHNPTTGLLADQVSLDEKQPHPITHRTWGQTEYLKALTTQMRQGEDNAEAQAAILIEDIFRAYIEPAIKGGYEDQVDRSGEIISTSMTTSTLYHLMSAGAELHALLE